MKSLVDQLREAHVVASGSSLNNGCVDCGLVSIICDDAADRIEALQVEVAKLRAALRPFAKRSEVYPSAKSGYPMTFGPIHDPYCPLVVGDFHRARAALSPTKEQEGEG